MSFAELLGDDPIDIPRRYVPSEDNFPSDREKCVCRYYYKKLKQKKGCAQIKNIIKNQQDISEPTVGEQVLSIAKYCNRRG
jgi:hypothetical protein